MEPSAPNEEAPSASPGTVRRPRLKDFGLIPLVILFILNAVDEFDRAVLAVALEDIRAEFDLSDATVGLLPLAVIFITGILSLPAGNWADRYRRINILSAGAIVWGSAGMVAAASQSFIQLFLTRALLGAGQGTIVPTHASLISDYYPVSIRGRALGYHRAANPLGQVIGAVIGGLIVGAAGWRWGFAAAAIPGVILGLYALRLREPRRGEADIVVAAKQDPLFASFMNDPDDKLGFFASLGTIWRISTLRILIFTNAAFGFSLFGVVFWIPALFEREFGFSTEGGGLALAALALASFVGTWYGGPFADRNVAKGFTYVGRIGVLATILLTLTWSLAFVSPNAALCLLFLSVGALLASLGVPGLTAIVAAVSPPRIRSQAFAAFGLALAVCGAAIAPFAVGQMSDLLQAHADMSNGESLRWSMLAATSVVMAIGTYLAWLASRTAARDVQATMQQFFAEYQARAAAEQEAAGGGT
ncbi:MAG TPA: MFS transporter [Tepidiformaceae bacterium]|nr:MFS transporter [Tepidiformaceae bacterium]